MNSYDNNSYYYRLDSHGNVTNLLTHTGDEIKSYTYNPYGKEKPFSINPAGNETILYHWKNETENTHNPFRYCGEYYDEESGLIYLRNRYYDPSIGRFITEDPHWNLDNMIYGDKEYSVGETKIPDVHAIMQSNNSYAYCMNNPIKYIDTSGLWVETAYDIASFVWSVGDVISNPKDPLAWAGLVGDVVDFIPAVTGVGETIKASGGVVKLSNVTTDVRKTTKAGVKVVKEVADSKVLRKNLIAAGKNVPEYKNAAHHIVAGNAKGAKKARGVLENFGIGINDAANGVFLPTVKGVSKSAYHPGLHTDEYYKKVNSMLKKATSQESALKILKKIGKELEKGTF